MTKLSKQSSPFAKMNNLPDPEQLLTQSRKDLIVDLISAVEPTLRKDLYSAFKEAFNVPSSVNFSNTFTTERHLNWVIEFLEEEPLAQNEKDLIVDLIKKLSSWFRKDLYSAFYEAFNVPSNVYFPDAFTTKKHAKWIKEYIARTHVAPTKRLGYRQSNKNF